MRGDVRVMVLVNKRFDGLAVQERHVLAERVARLHVIVDGHQLVSVLDTQHLQHLAVQVRQVINLWGLLAELDRRLVLHDPLGHRGAVRIADRYDLHHVVVGLLGPHIPAVRGVRVILRGVLADDGFEEFELLAHAPVDPCLHRRHQLELALQKSQRGTHRGLGGHVADLHISN